MRRPSTLTTWASLLTSTGTLLCCALPVLLVTLGSGALVAGVISELPWLAELSRIKEWLFLASGLLLATCGWLLYRPGRTCPADPELAEYCARIDRLNQRVWMIAAAIWMAGFFVAYLLVPLQGWLGV